jgi:outer membrane protein assembly factor BamA
MICACSSTKYVTGKSYLLEKVEIKSDTPDMDISKLEPYIRQKANSKWFSVFKIPLGTYSLSGRDTTRWINRVLRNIGEKPVLYDTLQAKLTCEDLRVAMHNMGYMNASVMLNTRVKKKKLTAIYTLHPGEPYYIRTMHYDIQDENIAKLLNGQDTLLSRLAPGMKMTVGNLDSQRKRITTMLLDNGYYLFHKDFIVYSADSVLGSKQVDLTLHLLKYRKNSNSEESLHPWYKVRNVNFISADSGQIHLRHNVLVNNTAIKPLQPFCASALQKTYDNFSRLHAVRYTNIRFVEVPDTNLLDCNLQISTNKPSTISFQPEGTNTAGDLGAAMSLTYENRNLFRGSELLSIQLRGAYEAIKGLEGYQNQNYEEYQFETKIAFPRFMAPFLSKNFRNTINAVSELSLSYNLQNRPEFHRRVFSAAWRYKWNETARHTNYKIDLIDLNYVYMPWISATFKHDYLDSISNRNAILRYNYEDLFIMKIGFGFTYNNGRHALKLNFETAGNLLDASAHLFGYKKNASDQYTLFNIAYAQYVKGDFDYTKIIQFDIRNSIVMHAGFGIAYPYGNSNVLPFEKRYFSGGANSVRGWSVRELGPGKFRGTDGAIDFINHTGDMKLDLNLEYRTSLFWKLNGAAFIDAGNIWTLRSYAEQPGGQFKLNTFYKEIAVAYGLGLRLNFSYFILRMDMGMKAINPAYESRNEHYAIFHPNFSRDFAFHFAVGLPF